jgi:NAD/NADP transhydrogenase alpha subunit
MMILSRLDCLPDRGIYQKRVALTPAAAANLMKNGFTVNVEKGAGFEAKFLDADYAAAGCNLIDAATDVYASDILLKVRLPSLEEAALVKDGGHLISFVYPAQNQELLDVLAAKNATVLGMECVPRISRAQVDLKDLSFKKIVGLSRTFERIVFFSIFE